MKRLYVGLFKLNLTESGLVHLYQGMEFRKRGMFDKNIPLLHVNVSPKPRSYRVKVELQDL